MKNVFLLAAMLLLSAADMMAQTQYAVITSVESIIPAGLGRSRIISNKENLNSANYTTKRTDGTTSDMASVKREDLKIDNFEETKLLNFYSATGINFQNVASNDAIISAKLNEMAERQNGEMAEWAKEAQVAFAKSASATKGGQRGSKRMIVLHDR